MSNNIKTTVEELRKLVNVDNVIGSPIETEDKILIPVIRMGVGFGAGENKPGEENNGISATGAGAGVEPISMVMIPKKVKSYMDSKNDADEYYDESEYIEPEFSATEEIEE